MALKMFLVGALLAVSVMSASRITELDPCGGNEVICLNDTVAQYCISLDDKQKVVFGNPYMCDTGEVCKVSQGGCYTPPPFVCTVTGTFPDPAVCTRYHVCTITSSYIKHITYLCGIGKVYRCSSKSCVAESSVTESCSVCRED